ncbi:bifunctional DNA primase/polymerase [Aminobacter sp. SR38]|jgi:putative DNA primase/helicase|uniref:bifunctional DNA primase/polymerase n=1 Tax=Aminobacter sp. SR38 TaxID=2774562 RepID=UPI00177B943E|nr:bifunctional DNA primase/polymerase [Aminobacter sp. SR38]QOF73632.1 bifunctional DNA primase/polymerase [Aminobacter sp. SR38]
MRGDVLLSAHFHLSLGLAVLPLHLPVRRGDRLVCSCGKIDCRQPAKHPIGKLVSRGLLDASKDRATIERWFSNTTYNIGIATGAVSGIVALDIDPRHDGHETLAALEDRHGTLPLTWRFLTGGGGEHILFRHPGDKIANSAGALGRGIDVRGDGGYIVAPPSTHICGRPYAISVDHHPDEVPLADLPEWLLDQLIGRKHGDAVGKPVRRNWCRHVAETHAEGQRNDAVARLAGHLLRARVDPRVCLMLIIAWNRLHCLPPLDDDEVVVTVRSIAAREIARREQRHAG